MPKRHTEFEFLEKLKNKFPHIDFTQSLFTGTNRKITAYCKEHGSFSRQAGDLLRSKKGCPTCGRELACANHRLETLKVGSTFGYLTVLGVSETHRMSRKWKYRCHCKCGKYVNVLRDNLETGHTKSCGCYNIQSLQDRALRNEIEVLGNITKIKVFNSEIELIIDSEDWPLLKDHCWCINAYGYGCTNLKMNDEIEDRLIHRVIMSCPKDKVIDHINHDKLDNRKQNLRICSQKINSNNIYFSSGSSGVRGVSYSKSNNKWHAYITTNGFRTNLGYYDTEEQAIEARKRGILEYKDPISAGICLKYIEEERNGNR